MSSGYTKVWLVWTRRGRRFYVLANDGNHAIRKVNRYLHLRAQERNSRESSDQAVSAFDWTDQEIMPAGRWMTVGKSVAD